MSPPRGLLARIAARGSMKHGNVAEKRTAKRLGGRQTLASGALEGDKGDIEVGDELLVEHKATIKDSLSIPLSWLCKISHEAADKTRIPALAINFTNGDGSPRQHGSWVAIPEWKFRDLLKDGRL